MLTKIYLDIMYRTCNCRATLTNTEKYVTDLRKCINQCGNYRLNLLYNTNSSWPTMATLHLSLQQSIFQIARRFCASISIPSLIRKIIPQLTVLNQPQEGTSLVNQNLFHN